MRSILLILSLFLVTLTIRSQVKVYNKVEIIPTYKIAKEELSPVFYTGRGVQGAEGRVYPYPSQANLGDSLVDVEYEMVYLENEYLKVSILPAFGGKLFSAIDKTNGHELFHTNSVIKFDLIGTLGAWASGGIEWCFPHHHRTTHMLPSDYTIVENEDSSITVWTGETDKTMGMRGVVGITLRPGKSYIEADYRINNTNKLTKTFLFWANVAVTADENFRTSWPPSQEIGVYHHNTDFTHWPISNQKYHSSDYTKGVDLTWWKNHPNPESFFFWDGKEGFIAGYDYGEKAGMVHVGDPNKNKTSKLWQFGPGLQGQNARRKLTDDNKAYVELMTGTFSNNQPDYSWIAPHAVKDAKNYWYPLKDIEVVKNATIDASLTLQLRDDKTVFYGFNTTGVFNNAKAILKYGDEIFEEKVINISPSSPYTSTYKSENTLDEYALFTELKDENGSILVSYTPYKATNPELPPTIEKPKRPEEIESVEDLYLAGRFIEQSFVPGNNPDDYYLAALEKSPNDYRVNTALGIRKLNQFKYEDALRYLQVAADKLKVKYHQPKEGEIYYYLALAQKELGLVEEAYRNFAQATWYYEWFSAGYFEMALIESEKGNYSKALEYIQNSYSSNMNDGRINVLYSALLRKTGNLQKAEELMDHQIKYDPLNFTAYYEKNVIKGLYSMSMWHKNMSNVEHIYLDMACNYLNAGLLEDGIKLLSSLENPNNPLILYYLAWFYSDDSDKDKALEMIQSANTISLDYCFPYRQETEKVLRKVIELDTENSRAYYLLGNLLYDTRPALAMEAWEKASNAERDIPMVWRNLAFGAFYHLDDIEKSIRFITKAIEEKNDVPLWFAELSKYYTASNYDFKECLRILRNNVDVVKKDVAAPKMLVELYNLNGEYDEALDFLKNHHFRTWEGGRGIYWKYVDALVLKARQLMDEKNYAEAMVALELAREYPENLEVAKSSDDEKNALIYYHLGLAYNSLMENDSAQHYFKKSTEAKNGRRMDDLIYFQAKSYEALGEKEKAIDLYEELIRKGEDRFKRGVDNSGIGVEDATFRNNQSLSIAFYLKALGHKGLGKEEEAKILFEKALSEYKNNLWARILMD